MNNNIYIPKLRLLLVIFLCHNSCSFYENICQTGDISCNSGNSILALVLMGPSYLGDSNQTQCESGSTMQSCPAGTFGQDADYQHTPSVWTLQLTDAGESVQDTTSGLVWQRCSRGQTFDGSSCSAGETTHIWTEAVSYCNGLSTGGRSWHLPTAEEFNLIGNNSTSLPALDPIYFPGQPASVQYWSATEQADDSSSALQYWAANGDRTFSLKSTSRYVRCISGSIPSNQFQDNDNGTINDLSTQLMWLQCPLQTSGAGDSTAACINIGLITWVDALNYCENLEFADYSDWRLPSNREMASIIEYASYPVAINGTYFPTSSLTLGFWSSTSNQGAPGSAYEIGFNNTTILRSNLGKTGNIHARCVRSNASLFK